MRPDSHYDELEPGWLFTHGQLTDPMTAGSLYCRVRAFGGAQVE
jgi:hypothetical protein